MDARHYLTSTISLNMNKLIYNEPKNFSTRKVSVDRVVKMLSKNGIKVNRENAEIILDFLYLLAKTYKSREDKIIRK